METYRVYVTDALKLITENTAKSVQGNHITVRYQDALAELNKKEETRTAEDIISHIRKELRGGEEDKPA